MLTYEEAYELVKKKEPGFIATRVFSYRDLFLIAGEDTMAGQFDNWIRSVNKITGEVSTFYINPMNIGDVYENMKVVKEY